MKQEEFEWLKKWLHYILKHCNETSSLEGLIREAGATYPPPIDEGIDTRCVFGPTKVCTGGEEPDCNRECEGKPKPHLKVGIASASCCSHDTDFISKGGRYYCPGCFPEGFAGIDKRDLEFYLACKSYKEEQLGVCPCCRNTIKSKILMKVLP